MEAKSGLLQAGEILLLVGAILSAVSAFFMLLMGAFMGLLADYLSDSAEGTGFVAYIYIPVGIVLVVGSVLGFKGWNAVKNGDLARGFSFGLACALLPPLQIVPLLGAIFVKVCPESEAS